MSDIIVSKLDSKPQSCVKAAAPEEREPTKPDLDSLEKHIFNSKAISVDCNIEVCRPLTHKNNRSEKLAITGNKQAWHGQKLRGSNMYIMSMST